MGLFDIRIEDRKKSLYTAIVLTSAIAAGCYIGFGQRRKNPDHFRDNAISRYGLVVRGDSTVFEDGVPRACMVNLIYSGDIDSTYNNGPDTLDISLCKRKE